MDTWLQVYDPLGQAWLSTLVAGLPVLVLLGLLVAGLSAPRAAVAGLATALAVAIFAYRMPVDAALAAATYGGAFGLFPIGWIVFGAVFLYQLTVRSGHFEIVRQSVAALSPDRRIQALLIGFSFGAFVEGAAGFGTPVAISAALLIGLGFPPLLAAGIALLANTAPVAFGGLGIPIITLAKMVQTDPLKLPQTEFLLSSMAGRQLPFFAVLIPIWMTWVIAGWRGVRGCWPAILVCGGSFATIQFLLSNLHGPTLVDVVGGMGSLACLAVFLRFWRPRTIWRFANDPPIETTAPHLPIGSVAVAWLPWVLLSVMVFAWGLPDVKQHLKAIGPDDVPVPRLDQRIVRTPPVVATTTPEKAAFSPNILAGTGTAILLAALVSALVLRLSPALVAAELLVTLRRLGPAILTIACMLALGFVTKYSGSDATLGLAFTRTGWLYPFFAPLLGWLGVALTGSDTSSNALFGGLQKITAEQLNLNTTLIVASNSTGGVMGKMIDAQSIVVAAVATGQHGQEGSILRFVLPHSLMLAALVGVLTFVQAYFLPGMIPAGTL